MNPRFLIQVGAIALACSALTACDKATPTAEAPKLEDTATAKLLKGTEAEKQLTAAGLLKIALAAAVEKEPPPLMTSKKLTAEEKIKIAGDDTNGNGIRDDVETKLVKATRLTERQRLALAQNFKANQAALLVDQSNDEAVSKAKDDLLTGWQCVAENFGFSAKKPGISQFLATLEADQNNTPERKNRFENLGCDALKVLLIDSEKMSKLSPKPCVF